MSDMRKPLALAAVLLCALTAPVAAQENAETAEPEAPVVGDAPVAAPGDLSMGEEIGTEGGAEPFIAESFGDWQMRCISIPEEQDSCQLYQLLDDAEGNSVAEISMFALPAGQQAAAGATIVTPLETLLTQQITIQVDGAQAKRYPFTWCSPIGCIARVGFTQAEVDAFKRGSRATMTIVPVAAPDQQVALDISLTGFTAGYDAVAARNAEADAN